jgi:hypothetical protein
VRKNGGKGVTHGQVVTRRIFAAAKDAAAAETSRTPSDHRGSAPLTEPPPGSGVSDPPATYNDGVYHPGSPDDPRVFKAAAASPARTPVRPPSPRPATPEFDRAAPSPLGKRSLTDAVRHFFHRPNDYDTKLHAFAQSVDTMEVAPAAKRQMRASIQQIEAERRAKPTLQARRAQAGPAVRNDPSYHPSNLDLGTNAALQTAVSSHVMPNAVTSDGPVYNISAQGIAATMKRELGDPDQGGRGTKLWSATESTVPTASGYGQFSADRWQLIAFDKGSQLNRELMRRGILNAKGKLVPGMKNALLKLRSDPDVAAMGIADYAKHNLAQLQQRGMIPRDANQGDLDNLSYVLHHEGTGGGLKLLQGDYSSVPKGKLLGQTSAVKEKAYMDANCNHEGRAYAAWLFDHTDQTNSAAFMRVKSNASTRSTLKLAESITHEKYGTPAAPMRNCPKPARH